MAESNKPETMAPEIQTETRELPAMELRAAIMPNTMDENRRTVEVTWTTGARGKRYGWDGAYYEELAVTPDAVRMGRLESGAPVLDGHEASAAAAIGVVERAWITETGEGRAILRFSSTDERAQNVFLKIQEGILTSVSVGYVVHKMEQAGFNESDGLEVYRAVDWEPMELSVVAIPFDGGARVRSGETLHAVTIQKTIFNRADESAATIHEGESMTKEVAQVEGEGVAVETRAMPEQKPAPVVTEPKAPAVDAVGILTAVRQAGIENGAEFAQGLIERGLSLADARGEVLAEVEKRQAKVTSGVEVGQNRAEIAIRGIENALHARVGLEVADQKLANEFRGLSTVDMARECLQAAGVSTRGMSKQQVVTEALAVRSILGGHSISDFANILANTVGRKLRAGYEAAPATYRQFSNRVELPDFRQVTSTQLDDAPDLDAVTEHAEFTRGTMSDNGESYQATAYGKIIAITRQALINDDLGAFDRIAQSFGMRAMLKENNIVYSLLSTNAAMSDGNNFFSVAHGNLTSGAGPYTINATNVGAARQALREQTAPNGSRLNLAARYLIVGPAKETEADQFLDEKYYPATQANVTPANLRRPLTLIVDAEITDAAWYVAADPMMISGVEYGFVQGNEGVYTETRAGWDVDGLEIKARMDFGAGLVEYRGWQKFAAS